MRVARLADRLVDAVERQIRERVAAQLLGDLLDGAPVGDHLLARRHVDAVVARVLDRRRRDPHVDLLRAGVAEHLDDLARRVAADDRVVDDDQALARHHLGQRVELQPQAVLAQLLAGLDERARDVAVLHEAVVLGQAGRPCHAARGGVARVRHRDDQVGVDRRLVPQPLAHAPARDLQYVAAHPRVRAREVDVLEDAERLALGLDDLARGDPALAEPDHLPGRDVAQQLGADDVQRARLAGHAVAAAGLAEHERAQPRGVAERGDLLAREHDGGERTLHARHDVGDRVLDAVGRMRGDQRGDDLRVRRRGEADAAVAQLAVQLDRVGQVAIVREGDLVAVRTPHRLRVLPRVGPGRRVAHVTDRHVADERAQRLLVEDLVDQPEVALGQDVAAAVGRGDARRLLPAVLEGVQREVREAGDVVLGRIDAEDAALVTRSVAVIRLEARLDHVRRLAMRPAGASGSDVPCSPTMRRSVVALTALAASIAVPSAADAARPSVPAQSVAGIAASGKATVLVARGRGRARVAASLRVGDLVVAGGRPRVVRLSPRRSRRVTITIPRDDRWALQTCAAPGTVVVRAGARAGRRLRQAQRTLACPFGHAATGRAALAELPVLDPLTHVAQVSSHARDGTNGDSGHDLGTDEQGRHVLLDVSGPGAITRIWFTSAPDDSFLSGDPADIGRIQIFFDGERAPRVDLPAPELFSGTHAPFLAPVCGNYLVSSGGNCCDLRMPFRKGVRITVTKTTYYDIGYETYPAGTPVSTFDPATADGAGAAALYRRAGSDPQILPAGSAADGAATLAAGARKTIANLHGGGTIRGLEVGVDPAALQDVWLEARWDGERQPSVAAPLADLFLTGAGERGAAAGLLAGYAPARHAGYLRFPMPY